MTDKAVGELWHKAHNRYCDCASSVGDQWKIYHSAPHDSQTIINLIRKLVEERAQRYSTVSKVSAALHDFGIDEKEWSK